MRGMNSCPFHFLHDALPTEPRDLALPFVFITQPCDILLPMKHILGESDLSQQGPVFSSLPQHTPVEKDKKEAKFSCKPIIVVAIPRSYTIVTYFHSIWAKMQWKIMVFAFKKKKVKPAQLMSLFVLLPNSSPLFLLSKTGMVSIR